MFCFFVEYIFHPVIINMALTSDTIFDVSFSDGVRVHVSSSLLNMLFRLSTMIRWSTQPRDSNIVRHNVQSSTHPGGDSKINVLLSIPYIHLSIISLHSSLSCLSLTLSLVKASHSIDSEGSRSGLSIQAISVLCPSHTLMSSDVLEDKHTPFISISTTQGANHMDAVINVQPPPLHIPVVTIKGKRLN